MDARGPFIRPNRGMRPPFPPMRVRPMMMMDPHVRHLPPRPHMMMRGGLPPFSGRLMMPPRGPRGPPVMLPHRVPFPGGPMGPLGPRGMLALPRPMLPLPPPPRVFPQESSEVIGNTNVLDNKESEGLPNLTNIQNDTIMKNGPTIPNKSNLTQSHMSIKKPRKDSPRNGRPPQHPGPPSGQHVPNMHPGIHISQRGSPAVPPQQRVDMSQPKNIPPLRAPIGGSVLLPTQPPQVSLQDNASRGPRNSIQHMNRGNAHNIGNRGNLPMNYTQSTAARPNVMLNRPMGVPPVQGPYSTGPPPSYPMPPPQVAMKRGPPTAMNAPPATVMGPKRIRYDAPSNGYPPPPYQPPPQQQTSYPVSYEMPPLASNPIPGGSDMYGSASLANVDMAPVQTYNNVDYENYQMVSQTSQNYGGNGIIPYSTSYDTNQSYSVPFSTSSPNYSSSLDYSSMQTQNAPIAETYAPTVDSYGYNNATYPATQSRYQDYSSNYVDDTAYSQPVPDQSYAQNINTYPPYSY